MNLKESIAGAINSPLFRSAIAGGVGALLILEHHPLYAGIAIGVAIREFLMAFKKAS
jgi:hypothetical protein